MAGGEDHKQEHDEEGTWSFHTEGHSAHDTAPERAAPAADGSDVTWSASEFIVHEKGAFWYVAFGVITVVAAAVIYLITRDFISVAAVVILAGVFVVAASRKPRIVDYRLDRGGISVGRQFHPYGNFKSFAVVDEGPFASITLLPLKRFAMPLSIYFSPEDEPKILDVLSNRLPIEPGELDSLDRFMRSIHF